MSTTDGLVSYARAAVQNLIALVGLDRVSELVGEQAAEVRAKAAAARKAAVANARTETKIWPRVVFVGDDSIPPGLVLFGKTPNGEDFVQEASTFSEADRKALSGLRVPGKVIIAVGEIEVTDACVPPGPKQTPAPLDAQAIRKARKAGRR